MFACAPQKGALITRSAWTGAANNVGIWAGQTSWQTIGWQLSGLLFGSARICVLVLVYWLTLASQISRRQRNFQLVKDKNVHAADARRRRGSTSDMCQRRAFLFKDGEKKCASLSWLRAATGELWYTALALSGRGKRQECC